MADYGFFVCRRCIRHVHVDIGVELLLVFVGVDVDGDLRKTFSSEADEDEGREGKRYEGDGRRKEKYGPGEGVRRQLLKTF